MNMELKLYGREYCSLCREMREQLTVQRLQVHWLDVDDDPALEARYGELVPVLTGRDERVICHYQLDQAALDAYLAEFS